MSVVELHAPSVSDATDIGLNMFAFKLVAECMPALLVNLEKLKQPTDSPIVFVLTSKDGTRWKLTVQKTEYLLATPGDGAL